MQMEKEIIYTVYLVVNFVHKSKYFLWKKADMYPKDNLDNCVTNSIENVYINILVYAIYTLCTYRVN